RTFDATRNVDVSRLLVYSNRSTKYIFDVEKFTPPFAHEDFANSFFTVRQVSLLFRLVKLRYNERLVR
ncbi:hypothetical protein, partial [Geobacillus stearothermophilus]|uniref:hypothetical protein n=1 Tax=Geobacillus stearothermophilus TaxID=1422 RepID=UPI003D1C0B45